MKKKVAALRKAMKGDKQLYESSMERLTQDMAILVGPQRNARIAITFDNAGNPEQVAVV